jgi:hypothetical protein
MPSYLCLNYFPEVLRNLPLLVGNYKKKYSKPKANWLTPGLSETYEGKGFFIGDGAK